MRPFKPVVRNPHLLTILGNYWPREYDFSLFAREERLIPTEPDIQVLVQTQHPRGDARGDVILVHGLEGAGDSGYMVSMAWDALNAGYRTHRFHLRTCGGTEAFSNTLYHAGLTSDLHHFIGQTRGNAPLFLVGFSLGGNVVLKAAGEVGERDWIDGVCAVSTPIDLGKSVKKMGRLQNRLYEKRFVSRMRQRMVATGRHTRREMTKMKTVYAIDDFITAPAFGFGTADNYYATQSAKNFLGRIRVPTLLIQAKDDPLVPFEIFQDPSIASNPHLRLIATEHGGHLGFLAKTGPRFWIDEIILEFFAGAAKSAARAGSEIAG
jgi:uncharacterized protein